MLRVWRNARVEGGAGARATAFLRALAEAAAATGSATTDLEVYERVVDTLQRLEARPALMLLGADGRLRVHRVGADGYLVSKAWELAGHSPDTFSIDPEVSPHFGVVLGGRRTIYLDDIGGLAADALPGVPRSVASAVTRLLGFTSIIMSPIVSADEVVGILALHHRDMRPDDVDVAELFARQMGDAVARLRMIESLSTKNRMIQQAQERALAAQRLEAMGKLAGGIAHDFNNLLSVIMASGSLVQCNLEEGSDDRRELDVLLEATERAALLTRQLLDFARRGAVSEQVFDLHARLRALEGILRRSVGRAVEVRVSLASAPGLVRADPSQFDQVVMNLTFNARDAMPDGGTLTVETAVGEHEIRLVVRDDGVGMDQTTAARVFEPFFSTKPRDEGTGLGMATCFGIITGLGGTISIESEPGRGTAVTVVLPRATEEEASVEGGTRGVFRSDDTSGGPA